VTCETIRNFLVFFKSKKHDHDNTFFELLHTFSRTLGVWAGPAHPLPNILTQFIQSNSFIKSTYQLRNQRACRVQPLSEEVILWITGHVAAWHYKVGEWSVHVWTPTLPESEGVRTQDPPQDRRQCHCCTVKSTSDTDYTEASKLTCHLNP